MQATFIFVLVIFSLALFVFWIWTIVDCIRNPNFDDTRRIMWILIIVLLGFIGSFIYLFMASRGGDPESF
ncbi:MAG TPA: PLDc N-terminal domain-containing protein [Balneolales bacterium]|nr:PLDc N-terminal domain-containing protein [Balneolales bacterium]